MKIIKKLIPLGLMAMPLLRRAVNVTSFDSLVTLVNGILDSLVPLIIGVAVVILLIAIVNYIRAGEEEEKERQSEKPYDLRHRRLVCDGQPLGVGGDIVRHF